MPYRTPPRRAKAATVRLPARHSNVVVFGALFFGAMATYLLWVGISEERVIGLYMGGGLLLLSLGLLYFTSTGVELDAERGGVVHWRGPGWRLHTSFTPVTDQHRLELVTKTVTHRASANKGEATITTHAVALVNGDERIVVAAVDDRNEARRRAELVARALSMDLHEENEGEQRTIRLEELDEPLRARLLLRGAPKRPKKPKKYGLRYQREGQSGTIEVPAPPLHYRPFLVYGAAVAAVVVFFFSRGTSSGMPSFIGIMGFAVLLAAILTRLMHHRTRARRETSRIVASPEGLQLSLKGLVRTREESFSAEKLEDLDIVQVGNSEIYALLARSDEHEAMFAAGTPRPALEWIHRAIEYHLTR